MTTHAHASMATTPLDRAFHRCIASVFTGWERRREIARTTRTLHRLPDSALHDIGVYRSEIGGVATFKRINDHI